MAVAPQLEDPVESPGRGRETRKSGTGCSSAILRPTPGWHRSSGRRLELGAAVWIDAKDLSGGDVVLQEILKAVHACDEAVVLVTPLSAGSQWVAVEIGAFLGQGKRVTPILNHVEPRAISPIQGVKSIDLNDLKRFLTELKERLGRARAGEE